MSTLETTDAYELLNSYAEDGTISIADIRSLKETLTQNPLSSLIPVDIGLSESERQALRYLNSIKHGLITDNEHVLFNNNRAYDSRTYTSFSGSEATVSVVFQFGRPVIIGECQTITYSLYRPIAPVYNLGSAKAAGYVRGPRTIAGSIIFTVFDRHILLRAFHEAFQNANPGAPCLNKNFLSDELPPFDLQVTFMNEYGQSSMLVIHGVYLTSEGQVMSIEDMITENTMQYLASDITLMRPNVFDSN